MYSLWTDFTSSVSTPPCVFVIVQLDGHRSALVLATLASTVTLQISWFPNGHVSEKPVSFKLISSGFSWRTAVSLPRNKASDQLSATTGLNEQLLDQTNTEWETHILSHIGTDMQPLNDLSSSWFTVSLCGHGSACWFKMIRCHVWLLRFSF